MTADMLMGEMVKCYAGFSDFRFFYGSIKEDVNGDVMVEDFIVSGTYDGDLRVAQFPAVSPTEKARVLE